MRANFPDIYDYNEIIRYQFRANHVYILLAGLINLLAGLVQTNHEKNWKKLTGVFAFVLIMVATILLIAAFFIEPMHAAPVRPLTAMGIFLTFLGVILVTLKR